MAYGSSFYGAGATGGGEATYLGDLNLSPYITALLDRKSKWESAISPYSVFKAASIATDAARDTALGALKTALGTPGAGSYTGRVYKGPSAYPRAVRLYEFYSGELIDTEYPDVNGLFTFSGIAAGKYYVTSHDFGTITKPIIQNITIT